VIQRTPPLLYSFRRCPYAMRARLALYTCRQTVEFRELVLRNKPKHMLEISPKATVPVLQLSDGQVIDESLDVMLWALAENDPALWLAPQLGTKDQMLTLIGRCENEFKHI
jgi:glutathione S-transferase